MIVKKRNGELINFAQIQEENKKLKEENEKLKYKFIQAKLQTIDVIREILES
jgi:hypothetical protein